MNRAGKIAKTVIAAIVLVLNGLFIFRCCIADDKSILDTLAVTGSLRAVYASDPDTEMLTHEPPYEIAENGYMSAYALVIIPEAEQVQITVRYNDSIYSYNNIPEGSAFAYTLNDSVTGEEISGTIAAAEERWMYNYRRLIFEGVTLNETNNLTVKIWYDDAPITSQLIHHADQNIVLEPYKLSRAEKEALGGN